MDRLQNGGGISLNARRELILERKGIVACGSGFSVAVSKSGTLHYVGDNRYDQSRAISWKDIVGVFCGPDYILGLGRDGTVSGAGRNSHGQLNVSNWSGVSLIACGPTHAAALLTTGEVLCTNEKDDHAKVAHWTDITDLCCGNNLTVGLRTDGQVYAAGGTHGMRHQLSKWTNIAGVFSDYEGKHIYGITADGRLVSTRKLPAVIQKWKNLVSVAATKDRICAVTQRGKRLSDRTMHPVVGENKGSAQKSGALAVAGGEHHIACLRKNGTVIGFGRNDFGQSEMDWWEPLFNKFDAWSATRYLDPEEVIARARTYQQRMTEAERYSHRLSCSERMTACLAVDGRVSTTAPFADVKHWEQVCTITCGGSHILALHRDGHVSADGNNVHNCCRVEDWTLVKEMWAGKYHSLALTEDGRVLFAGWNRHHQDDLALWKGIRMLRATESYTVGMDRSGCLYVTGEHIPFDPSIFKTRPWKGLDDVSISDHHIAGLTKDGRVIFEGDAYCGSIKDIKEEIKGWRGVRRLASGNGFVIGLCYGGHVVAAGRNHVGQCETDSWRQVVSIGCGYAYAAALTVDGQVLTAGKQRSHVASRPDIPLDHHSEAQLREGHMDYASCHTESWRDILTMACGPHHLVALDRHGHLFASGIDHDGQCTGAMSFLLFKDARQLSDYGRYVTAKSSGNL